MRLDGVTIDKNGGTLTGAAFVGWDSTYSFNADGRRIPAEQIAAFTFPNAPALSGLVEFTASGSGSFDQPRYDVRFRGNGLFIGEEGIGQVTGSLAVRGKQLSGEVTATSPRLDIFGTGRIALTPQADAEISFRFHNSSLDPYARLFMPKLSPFTTAVASGAIRVVGELADFDHLLVDGTVDSVEMSLFDYSLRNAAPIHLAPASLNNVVRETLELLRPEIENRGLTIKQKLARRLPETPIDSGQIKQALQKYYGSADEAANKCNTTGPVTSVSCSRTSVV